MGNESMEMDNCRYEAGSWSEWVHRFIEADHTDTEKLLGTLPLAQLQIWTSGLISEFEMHFPEKLRKAKPGTDEWKLIVDIKWNQIALVLAQLGRFDWAEVLYRSLYSLLCRLQVDFERVHKGTPLHQLGWLYFVRNGPGDRDKSLLDFKLALIEDMLSDHSTVSERPAYRALRDLHHLSADVIGRFIGFVRTSIEMGESKRVANKSRISRPELIYLEISFLPYSREKARLYDFDPDLANTLLTELNLG
jgi:hypothetical protein